MLSFQYDGDKKCRVGLVGWFFYCCCFGLDFWLGFLFGVCLVGFFGVCLCAFAVLFGIYQLNGEEKSPGETLADSGWRPISNIL